MTYTGDRERLFCEIKCGVYQVQLFFCIFSQSFSISSISFFPGLDTGMSGIWPGTGLETFLLSCAMPLMIHNFLEPCIGVDESIVPIYPGLLTFSFLLFHVFFYLQITFFDFLEFYTEKFQERFNSGWVFLLLFLSYFFSHFFFFLLDSPVLLLTASFN